MPHKQVFFSQISPRPPFAANKTLLEGTTIDGSPGPDDHSMIHVHDVIIFIDIYSHRHSNVS